MIHPGCFDFGSEILTKRIVDVGLGDGIVGGVDFQEVLGVFAGVAGCITSLSGIF